MAAVFEHWAAKARALDREPPAPNSRQRRMVAERLKEFGLDRLHTAIDMFFSSEWHVEKTDLEIATVMADRAKVEKFYSFKRFFAADVSEVFEHYLESWRSVVHGEVEPTLTLEGRRLIHARLSEFSVEQLERACDALVDAHHDRPSSIEAMMRNRNSVLQYLDSRYAPPPAQCNGSDWSEEEANQAALAEMERRSAEFRAKLAAVAMAC